MPITHQTTTSSKFRFGLAAVLLATNVSVVALTAQPAHASSNVTLKRGIVGALSKAAKKQIDKIASRAGDKVVEITFGAGEEAEAEVIETGTESEEADEWASLENEDEPAQTDEFPEAEADGDLQERIFLPVPAIQKVRAPLRRASSPVMSDNFTLNFEKIKVTHQGNAVGDVDNDGLTDLILNSRVCDAGGTNTVRAFLAKLGPAKQAHWKRVIAAHDMRQTCANVIRLQGGNATRSGGANMAFSDGSVRFLKASIDPASRSGQPLPAIYVEYRGIDGSVSPS